jgi:hypothetical protein
VRPGGHRPRLRRHRHRGRALLLHLRGRSRRARGGGAAVPLARRHRSRVRPRAASGPGGRAPLARPLLPLAWSLADIPPGTRLVLPSPNGAALSLLAGTIAAPAGAAVVAACLRNARAVAAFACHGGGSVAVIACGERWPDRSLRPAWEDLVGAGAVMADLPGRRSPETQAACDAFRAAPGGPPDSPAGVRLRP